MGIWQGINEAHLGYVERKDREKELQQAREDRMRERQEDQDFALRQYKMQVQDRRTENFLTTFSEIDQARAEAGKLKPLADSFYSRFAGMEDDPRVQTLMQDPMAAANLEAELRAVEVKRAERDVAGVPLKGATLLDMIAIPETQTGRTPTLVASPEEIFNSDLTDSGTYIRRRQELAEYQASISSPSLSASLSPSAYRIPTPESIKEVRGYFDTQVVQAASRDLERLKDTGGSWSELNDLVQNYDKNPAARVALIDQFGPVAMAGILESNSPYLQNVFDIPELQPLLAPASILILKRIIDDPQAPADQKEDARTQLREKFGVTY
jgi:hypothetical protein